jgi:hypothetical protein
MAPKANKLPLTNVFGRSKVSKLLIAEYETLGFFEKGKGRAHGSETGPQPRPNEVVVSHDLFSVYLLFPLDNVVVVILHNFCMYLHHLTPNAILHMSLYMLGAKTMGVAPNVASFVRVHNVHHQCLKLERLVDGALVREEAQFASLNFNYCTNVDVPVVCYENKWEDNWNYYWFYHYVEANEMSLACYKISNLPKGVGTAYEDGDTDWLFLVFFEELAKANATRDLVEEFCGAKLFLVHVR